MSKIVVPLCKFVLAVFIVKGCNLFGGVLGEYIGSVESYVHVFNSYGNLSEQNFFYFGLVFTDVESVLFKSALGYLFVPYLTE